jgi:hypothetical protein
METPKCFPLSLFRTQLSFRVSPFRCPLYFPGHLNPVTGVMRGQLKVRGDVKAALTFSGLMDIPSA